MKKYILLLCCLLFLPFVTSGQNIGDIRDVFSPVSIPKSGLPSWLNSEYSPVFNGVNGYASTTSDITSIPTGNSAKSIMFWVYDYNQPQQAGVFHYGPQLIGTGLGFYNFNATAWGPGTNNDAFSVTKSVTGIGWKHVAIVFQQGGTLGSATIFENGIENKSARTYYNGSTQNGVVNTVVGPLEISRWVGGSYGNYKISELSFWNRALSASEILKYKDKRLKGSEQGIVALYHMNEGPGNASQTLVDSVGGKNATCYGSVQWTKRNGFQPPDVRAASMALSLDGVDDYASATASNLPATASARTVMGWFFDADPTTTSYKCLFSYGTSSNGTLFGCLFKSNELHFGIALNTFKIAYTHNSKWTHYAFTLPSGGTLSDTSIYLDGVLASGSRTLVEGSLSTLVNTNAASGSFWVSSWIGSLPVKGKNGEWSLWNRALSQSEIQQYMYQSLTGSETGLVRYYKFNEGSGSTVKDYASGHYDATLYNSPTWIGRDIP